MMSTPSAVTNTMCGGKTIKLSDGRILYRPTMAHMIAVETVKNKGIFDAKSNIANVMAILYALEHPSGDVLVWARGMTADLFDGFAGRIDFAMFGEIEKAVNGLFAPMQTMIDAAGGSGSGNATAATGG